MVWDLEKKVQKISKKIDLNFNLKYSLIYIQLLTHFKIIISLAGLEFQNFSPILQNPSTLKRKQRLKKKYSWLKSKFHFRFPWI